MTNFYRDWGRKGMAEEAFKAYKEFYQTKYGHEYEGTRSECIDNACDAFRHAYCAAKAADNFGPKIARFLVLFVEFGGDVRDLYSDIFGSKNSQQTPERKARASDMDLGNNDIGIKTRQESSSLREAYEKIFEFSQNGGHRDSGNSYRQSGTSSGYQQGSSSGHWWERTGDWFRNTFTGSNSQRDYTRQEQQRQEQRRNEYRQQYSNARPGSNSICISKSYRDRSCWLEEGHFRIGQVL